MNNIHMYAALVTIAHGEPEWWTGPEQTGVQLLKDNAFAAEFVAEKTTADVREIRRIVFQMLGMDHLVLFIDACCNYLQPDASSSTSPKYVITPRKKRTEAMKVVLTSMIAAKKSAFNEDNIRRLLWFALECGLDLGPTTRHLTPSSLRKRGISPSDLCGISLRGIVVYDTMNTIELLTRVQVHKKNVDIVVTRAVLACITFNAETILYSTMRLYAGYSNSAVWYEILDKLFIYHQRVSPAASSMSILSKCLYMLAGKTVAAHLIFANDCDKQRRMLPYLLRKPDLNDASIIPAFNSRVDNVDHVIAMTELCCSHPNWHHASVKIINIFANDDDDEFIANVNRLHGVNVESHADIAAYVFANVKLGDTRSFCSSLMQIIAKHGAFDTVMKWMMSSEDPCRMSKVACIFAHRLFQTYPVAERAVIYRRYLKVHPGLRSDSTIIYYLMHGKDAVYAYWHRRSLYLVRDMLKFGFEDNAIAHIIDVSHAREYIPPSFDCGIGRIQDLCERELRFDLLMRLINRHCHVRVLDYRTEKLLTRLKSDYYCYSIKQRMAIITRIQLTLLV